MWIDLSLRAAVAALLATSTLGAAAAAAELNVEVRGIATSDGAVLLALYDAPERWLRQPLRAIRLPAQAGQTVRGSFGDLPPGVYAISAIHDRNGNGRLDSNALGIPTEPYAYSNDAAGFMGPARFEQARFTLGAQPLTLVIDFKGSQ
jgi:uncharacterized protein (DUF2141 family)